jgi:hypothetical protein
MRKFQLKAGIVLALLCFLNYQTEAQALLNKVKSAAKNKAANAIFGDNDNSSTSGSSESNERSGRPSNNSSGGLITTPPDVQKSIADAESSFSGKKFGEARYALQQAIVGIEMEMGNKVMESLPKKVAGIDYIQESDKVTSTGMAFVGLTIFREYYNDDQAVDITVANNSALLVSANMYLSNPSYTSGQDNIKSVTVQGFKGVIEYSEYDGYKLSVPLGQTSIAIIKMVNFANETAAMKVADAFDLAGIQKQLGDKIN